MHFLTKLIVLFILGIIEGITEFLPISSTGHMILIEFFLNCTNDSFVQIFTIVVQFGAILALMIVFKNRLYNISLFCIPQMFVKKHIQNAHLCIYHILIGTVPGVVFGVVFYKQIELMLFKLVYIKCGLILGSLFLLIGEYCLLKSQKLSRYTLSIENITYIQAFLVGCCQCLAFFPGFSRSGSTIGGGLLVGLSRRASLEFSFILSIPIMLGSIILTLYTHEVNIIDNIINFWMLLIGCGVTFVVSICVVRVFLNIIQRVSLIPFIIYRCLLAIIICWVQK